MRPAPNGASRGGGSAARRLRARRKLTRRPVSRVLFPASRRFDDHSSGTRFAPRLARPTRAECGNAPAAVARGVRPYMVLLPVGFAVPLALPLARCALAAPFHPCRQGRSHAGGLFSVALSLKARPWALPPPGVTRHRIPVEPGLSSPAVAGKRGRPAAWRMAHTRATNPSASPPTRPTRQRVSPSAMPSVRCGAKWRWKAVITCASGRL